MSGVHDGVDAGNFNKDGIPDITALRDGATNILYIGNIKAKKQQMKCREELLAEINKTF